MPPGLSPVGLAPGKSKRQPDGTRALASTMAAGFCRATGSIATDGRCAVKQGVAGFNR